MFQQLLTFLNQPYPDTDDWPSRLKGIGYTGLIVFGILYLLKPFGLQQIQSGLLGYTLAFGLIASAVSLIFDLLIRYVFRIRRDTEEWTLWKWMLAVSLLILCISFANYYFITIVFGTKIGWASFLNMFYNTVLIGIFPVVFFGGMKTIRQLRENQMLAATFGKSDASPSPHRLIELPATSGASLSVDVASILYVEAMQNYVNVVTIEEDQWVENVLRNTLANVADTLNGTTVHRCHRSFLVNTDHIVRIEGNAQGLRLFLSGTPDRHIPVSRKYIDLFRDSAAQRD